MTIDAENGSISVWNDGKGIPIQMHKEHHMYVPELIFGNLLTGSNFDDNEKKTTGGRNGFGAKVLGMTNATLWAIKMLSSEPFRIVFVLLTADCLEAHTDCIEGLTWSGIALLRHGHEFQ